MRTPGEHMSDKSHYEILGISRSATNAEIQKAYRQLALRWHPDRNPAPEAAERFRNATMAYRVLSDKQRRDQYDKFGYVGPIAMSSGFSWDVFNDFREIFGEFAYISSSVPKTPSKSSLRREEIRKRKAAIRKAIWGYER